MTPITLRPNLTRTSAPAAVRQSHGTETDAAAYDACIARMKHAYPVEPLGALANPLALPQTSATRRPAPPCLVCDQDGKQGLLRFAVVTAEGRSENHFPADMPEGAVPDYAVRGAVEAWSNAKPWYSAVTCPISLRVFSDPVIAPDGHTYERRHLQQWLQTHDTSPCTGASFLPDGTVAPYRIRVTSHAVMRDCVAWALAHNPPADLLADGVEPLTDRPCLHADLPVHVPPPPPRAVVANNLQGVQVAAGALPQVALNRQALFFTPARDIFDTTFCLATLALSGLSLGLANAKSSAPARVVGPVMLFASPLLAALCALAARPLINRQARARGIPTI